MREEEIGLSIDEVKARVEKNKEYRDILTAKLHQAACKIDFDNLSGKELLGKIEIFSTLNTMLDSNTKDAMQLVKAYMSEKASDQEAILGKQTVQFLKLIQGMEPPKGSLMNQDDLMKVDELLDSVETEEITDDEISE